MVASVCDCSQFSQLQHGLPDHILWCMAQVTRHMAHTSIDHSSLCEKSTYMHAGISRARLRDMYTDLGDLGDVAQACRHTQVLPSTLSFTRLQGKTAVPAVPSLIMMSTQDRVQTSLSAAHKHCS